MTISGRVSTALALAILFTGTRCLGPVVHGQGPSRPTAVAGPNQAIDAVGTLVRLDGSASVNPAAIPLTFEWAFVQVPDGSAAVLAGADTATPTFVPDRPGRYRVQLVVDNGTRSDADVVAISVNNHPPVAEAGPDRTAVVGQPILLDGSASSDPDGDPLAYRWQFDNKPRGSQARLANSTTVRATFVVDKPGTYVIKLTVNDGQDRAADAVTINVPNTAPTANAGPDQTVPVGARVVLDGSASTDTEGDTLRYNWTVVSVPAGSAARLSNRRDVNPSFVADRAGRYVLSLIVNDGSLDSAPDTVVISTGNSAPVANAGPDQTVHILQQVQLDGSGSSDVDGNALTFAWSFVERPAGSTAVLSSPAAIRPTFTVDRVGTYRLQLIVNDGLVNSAPDLVGIVVGNAAPVASAGADQSVALGVLVTLDGSGSTDADGDPLTYLWALTTVPAGSTAVLSSPLAVRPTFTADRPGTYVAQLIVSDAVTSSAPDTVSVTTANVAPVANAGPPQTVHIGQVALLDGSGSSDADGNPLTYAWSIITRPAGSATALNSPTSITPSFIPDREGDYVVQLIVNDGQANSAPGTVTITTRNSVPVARAGADQAGVLTGSLVSLDGSLSSDANGDPLTYSWSLLSRPAGSAAALSNPNAVAQTFIADVSGTYVAQLIVNDGFVSSAPDTVSIEVVDPTPEVSVTSTDASAAEAGPDPGAVTVARTGPTTSALTVFLGIAGTAGSADYSPMAGSVTIPIGASSAQVVITPIDDLLDEGSESVIVSLTANAAYTIGGTGQAAITIADNDNRVIAAVATIPDASEAGPAPGTIAFTRTGDTSVAVTLTLSRGGSAAESDYTGAGSGPSFQVTIPAGESSINVTITPTADNLVEGQETVSLTVAPDPTYTIGSPSSASVTIADDPPVVDVVAAMPDAFETGLVAGTLRIQRSGGRTADPLSVSYTIGGSALNGTDYTLISGSALVSGGDTFTTVTIGPLTDALTEGDETVTLTVAASAGYVIGASSAATVTIHDATLATLVSVTATDPVAAESGSDPGVFRFTRSGGTASSLTVSYSIGGTATNGTDYTAITGTIVIPAAAAFADLTIAPSLDGLVEGPETVIVTVTDAADYDPGTPATATVTIGDVGDPCAAGGGPLINGGTHCGRIGFAGETDVWTFTATLGERIGIQVGEITDLDDLRPWIRLMAPDGTILGNTSGVAAAAINGVVAPATGTYQVSVASFDSFLDGTGTYQLTMTHTPGPITISAGDEGGPIANGATHVGTIVKGDLDVWTFTANAGERIAIQAGEIADTADLRPWIRLWAPNGAVLGDTSGVAVASINGAVAPVTGTYLVLVASFASFLDGTGTYRLTVLHTPSAVTISPGDEGGPMLNGATHTGQITVGDLDVWTFDAAAGERIGVHVGQIVDNDDFRPWIRLWAPNGTVLGETSGVNAAAINGAIAPVAGTYYVLVASFDSFLDGTGTYRLTATHSSGPITITPGDEGGPLVNGAMHTGAIQIGDLDVWTFTANAGERIAAHVGDVVDADDFRPWLRIWAPNGTVLGDTAGVNSAAINGAVAPVAGTYLVMVASYDSGLDGTGIYRLTVAHTPGVMTVSPGDDGGPMTNGATHTGQILRGDMDVWTFTANAGDRIGLTVGQMTDDNDFGPWLRLWAPNGTVLGDTSGVAAAVINGAIAPATGTYFVLIASYDSFLDGTGTYRLTLARTPGPITVTGGDDGGPMTNGATHTGTMEVGDLDVWTFTATAGDRIAVHIGELTDNDDFRPWIRIWAPNGASLGDTSGLAAAVINGATAPVSGTYLVLVGSYDSFFDGTGTYQLMLARTPGPIAVSPGDDGGPLTSGAAVAGAIARGDLDVWTITAVAGDRISVNITETTDVADFRPWIRLWAPNGASLGDTAGLAATSITNALAPVSGTYLVLVGSYDSFFDGVGTYQLVVTR